MKKECCTIKVSETEGGYCVEIEGESEQAIRAVQRKLGLDTAAEEPRSYVSMLISHCETVGVSDRVLALDPV